MSKIIIGIGIPRSHRRIGIVSSLCFLNNQFEQPEVFLKVPSNALPYSQKLKSALG
jgi:hypothetical protein